MHDDIIVFFTAEEEERVTSYSPVVKAESFACTKNSTSGHVVSRLRGQNRAVQLRNSRFRARGLSVRDRTGPIPPPSTSKYFVEQTIIHRFSPPDFQARVERRTSRFVSITAVRTQTSQGEL